jgi:hypothetical protein
LSEADKVKHFWSDRLFLVLQFFWLSLVELVKGIVHQKIDVVRYVYPGLIVAVFFLARLDTYFAAWFDRDWMRLSMTARCVLVYAMTLSGILMWSFERAYLRTRFLTRLKTAFEYCGLIANRKFPGFISDQPIDEYVRRLKLFANGVPIKKFLENREALEAHFNVRGAR